jgi:AraC-like DNA-binding protein
LAKSRKRPVICVSAAAGLLDLLDAAGVSPDGVLRAAGLARAALADTDGFIPCAAFATLLEECARATQDECFGLHFGERYNPKDVGAIVYVALNSPTIAAACDNLDRYLHLHNEAVTVYRTVESDRVYLRHVLTGLGNRPPRQHNEYSLAVGVNLLRIMAGSQWTPLEVQLAHEAPRDTSEHERIFRCPISFECETNALAVERGFIGREVPAADPRLYPIMKRYLDQFLKAMPRDDGFLCSVRKAIGQSIADGRSTLGHVAKGLAMSRRALQRKLQDYGVDFKTLLDETRQRFAVDFLRNPNHTVTEIAFVLGYSEVSAFNRAFKRWTGLTPLEQRRRSVKSKL